MTSSNFLAISLLMWSSQSPTLPFLKNIDFPMTMLSPRATSPAWLGSKPLSISKLHNLTTSSPLFLFGERDGKEAGKRPHNLHRVRRNLFILEEKDLLGPRQSLLPVLEVVLPEGPERRESLAEHAQRIVKFYGRGPLAHLVREVPPRDERVLGLPAQVHDAAAGGGHGRREQGEGQVGREEPRGGHLLDASQVSRRSGHLKGGRRRRARGGRGS
jgi:hypothetical protein